MEHAQLNMGEIGQYLYSLGVACRRENVYDIAKLKDESPKAAYGKVV